MVVATHVLPDHSRQRQVWHADYGGDGYVVSGGAFTVPGAPGLTLAAQACEAYVSDISTGEWLYCGQDASPVGPFAGGDGTYWVLCHANLASAVAGWTRQPGTRYLYRLAASQPALPNACVWLASVTVSAGSITAVRDKRIPASFRRTGMYDVTDPLYGAVGDMSTECGLAIQAAIDALPSTGGTVYIPHGNYLCATGLSFKDKQNILVKGASNARRYLNIQASSLRYTGTDPFIRFRGANGCTLQGLHLTYTHAAYAAYFVTLDQDDGAQNTAEISILDCCLMGQTDSSLTALALIRCAELCYDVNIERCVFANAWIAIRGSDTATGYSNIVRIRDNLFLAGFEIVHILCGGSSWTITGNTFEPKNTDSVGMAFGTTAGVISVGLTYVGNWHADAHHHDTEWFALFGGPIHGALIASNYFQDVLRPGGGYAIYLGMNTSDGITIQGNFFDCPIDILPGNATRVSASGNFFGAADLPWVPNGSITEGNVWENGAGGLHVGPFLTGQAEALLTLRRPTSGNSLEFGHASTSGYVSALGHGTNNGHPFLAFNAIADPANANTYKTFGFLGHILESATNSGALIFGRAVAVNAGNQTLTSDMSIDSTGVLTLDHGLTHKALVAPYDASIDIDGALATVFFINIANNTAFTIENPTNCPQGTIISIVLSNFSGGAHGTITWAANWHLVGAAGPTVAAASNQTVTFFATGAAGPILIEISRTAGDVPN